MPDLLKRAVQWLDGRRKSNLSRAVTYRRGTDSVTIMATLGRSTFELDDGAGVLVRVESRDFIVVAADLVLNGNPVSPRSGDRIIEDDGVVRWIYEVTAIGGEPAWRWCDPSHSSMRIHAKQIDTE